MILVLWLIISSCGSSLCKLILKTSRRLIIHNPKIKVHLFHPLVKEKVDIAVLIYLILLTNSRKLHLRSWSKSITDRFKLFNRYWCSWRKIKSGVLMYLFLLWDGKVPKVLLNILIRLDFWKQSSRNEVFKWLMIHNR